MNHLLRLLALATLPAALAAQDPKPATGAPNGIPECKEMTKTASGLEYGFLKKGGDGQPPGPDDCVRAHYTGWLTDGTKFDSSRDLGKPSEFFLRGMIKGWVEALQRMTPGARCKLVVPGDLAYGAEGQPPMIPPNATVVFDIELLEVTVRVPRMRAARPEAQHAFENGVKWEIVKEGEGPTITANDGFAMRYAVWTKSGRVVDCSEMQHGDHIAGDFSTMTVPVLAQLAALCKRGTILRAEVPRDLYPSEGEDTVWELEVTKVSPIPAFRALDKAKTVTTQSGLQYEVLELGDGQSPRLTDTVRAYYTGWLDDGTRIESAHARDEPMDLPLRAMIKGWAEGLQLMKPGGKFLFRVPAKLAYGERGMPPKVGPNATLVYLIELAAIKPPPSASDRR
jgi:FKBP-type peptidyl-prolyl cis-trans isomerase